MTRAACCAALLLVACGKHPDANANADANADANANAGSPLPPAEMLFDIGLATDDAGRTRYALRSDGTFTTHRDSTDRSRPLPKVTTASVLALADEAIDACAEAGAGARATLVVTHEERKKTVSHDATNDACARALTRLERRLVGLR